MRVTLESFRFVFIFFVLLTVLSVMSYMIYYSIIGDNAERYYGWTAAIGTFVIMLFLYRNKGWGKGYIKKSILWLSLVLVVLLAMFIPDLSPTHLHTDRFVYSYGFPFNFLTVYSESGSKFLTPNLLSSGDVNMSIGILLNFIIFYFVVRFIFGKRKHFDKTS
ncbi:peptidoglycan/LPS O-acetylase OafA/YrhL [Salibacterium salarium]|uniref:hypothetical protein n=1 Tax=Salibacterium salarium TaxID=284579 RepID=UPI002788FC37|nr:hypothetical protein [Salibacterium salarium]MDQ0297769.1 peptidoglycan/LPS O-acetylase OafA/YrhL [Salibacterium salarium]